MKVSKTEVGSAYYLLALKSCQGNSNLVELFTSILTKHKK